MRSFSLLTILSLTALGLAGCSDEPATAPNSSVKPAAAKPNPPPPPAPVPAPAPAESQVMQKAPASAVKAESEAKKPRMTLGPPPASPESKKPGYMGVPDANVALRQKIKLSAGVALPQTGPEGHLMSFSVDYEFMQETPVAKQYFWVIERTQGDSAKVPAPLTKKQGNLMTLIPKWRPTEGPFQTHLEDENGNPISETVELVGQN